METIIEGTAFNYKIIGDKVSVEKTVDKERSRETNAIVVI